MLFSAVPLKSMGRISAEMTAAVEAFSGFGTAGIARSDSHLFLSCSTKTNPNPTQLLFAAEAVKRRQLSAGAVTCANMVAIAKMIFIAVFIVDILFILQRVRLSNHWKQL
jgi:hypothetical protein